MTKVSEYTKVSLKNLTKS